MSDKLDQLKIILGEVSDLYAAAAVLGWDQQTYLPPGGMIARGNQLGTLQSITHSKFISEEVGAVYNL